MKELKQCSDSTIKGTLKCHNSILKIFNSTLDELYVLQAPTASERSAIAPSVILHDTYVRHIIFGNNAGVVKLYGTANIGTIAGGKCI